MALCALYTLERKIVIKTELVESISKSHVYGNGQMSAIYVLSACRFLCGAKIMIIKKKNLKAPESN